MNLGLGISIMAIGFAFVGLGLLAAAKDVLSGKPEANRPEQNGPESAISEITELTRALGQVRRWLAVSIFGFVLIVVGLGVFFAQR